MIPSFAALLRPPVVEAFSDDVALAALPLDVLDVKVTKDVVGL